MRVESHLNAWVTIALSIRTTLSLQLTGHEIRIVSRDVAAHYAGARRRARCRDRRPHVCQGNGDAIHAFRVFPVVMFVTMCRTVKGVYDALIEAKRSCGEPVRDLSFAKFHRLIMEE